MSAKTDNKIGVTVEGSFWSSLLEGEDIAVEEASAVLTRALAFSRTRLHDVAPLFLSLTANADGDDDRHEMDCWLNACAVADNRTSFNSSQRPAPVGRLLPHADRFEVALAIIVAFCDERKLKCVNAAYCHTYVCFTSDLKFEKHRPPLRVTLFTPGHACPVA
jgi:hypothetical protein